MLAYRTPGVYFEWPDSSAHEIRSARVDIAGFVGLASRGPLCSAVRVESWNQFTSVFGGYYPQGYLAYAIQGFFSNGGRTCWVVRVADAQRALPARLDLIPDPNGAKKVQLTASSPGVWAHDMELVPLRSGPRFSFMLRRPTGEQEIWRDLSVEPDDDRDDDRFVETVLTPRDPTDSGSRQQAQTSGSTLVTARVTGRFDRVGKIIPTVGPDGPPGRFDHGADGLASLEPEHIRLGLEVLADIPEISVVAIPDIQPTPRQRPRPWPVAEPDCTDLEPRADAIPLVAPPLDWPPAFTPGQIDYLQLQLVGHCERLKDRVAILDAGLLERSQEEVIRRRRQFDSSYAALYHPWLRVPDPADADGGLKDLPPSGHVAGIYARVEGLVGPHKPPANEVVVPARDVTVAVDDVQHGYFNDHRVNVIRSIPGRGLRVAGARTLSSDPQWRYVNVRRLFLMIERAVDAATQWLVFEPNDPALWRDLDRILRVYLGQLWQRGMLEGATADEAYSVVCDATSNPPAETDAGRMVAVIGIQPPWPAEFVVARIGKTEGGVAVL
jgi:phage tail sheath protein FI